MAKIIAEELEISDADGVRVLGIILGTIIRATAEDGICRVGKLGTFVTKCHSNHRYEYLKHVHKDPHGVTYKVIWHKPYGLKMLMKNLSKVCN